MRLSVCRGGLKNGLARGRFALEIRKQLEAIVTALLRCSLSLSLSVYIGSLWFIYVMRSGKMIIYKRVICLGLKNSRG